MRDLIVASAILSVLPFVLRYPYVGILLWSWLGYMNPHRLTWGFAYSMPWAQFTALATFVGILFSKEPKRIPWTRESVVLLIFVLWMFLTTWFAIHPWAAWPQWDKVWKIQLMTFVTLMVMYTPERVNMLVWTIALSLAFYGVKGGLFTLMTGGVHRVLGPPESFITNRGDVGTALNMVIPLLRYLQLQATHRLVRLGLMGGMVLTAFAVIGTHSRGAFLGLVAVLFMLILKTRRRFILTVVLVAAAVAILSFMPSQWSERMESIEHYEQDKSAQGRLIAWANALEMAAERPYLAPGFGAFAGSTAAHSIYFQVIGEQGYIGFILFMTLGVMTWRSASWIRRRTAQVPEYHWMRDLAAMIQVAIVGYASGGAFISLAYFDMTYHLVAIVVLCKTLLLEHEEAERKARAVRLAPTGPVPRAVPSLPGLPPAGYAPRPDYLDSRR